MVKPGVDGGLTTRRARSKIFWVFIGKTRFASVKLTLRFCLTYALEPSLSHFAFIAFRLAKPSPIYRSEWQDASDSCDQGRIDHLGASSLRLARNLPIGAAISGPRMPITCGT